MPQKKLVDNTDFLGNLYFYLNLATKFLLKFFNNIVVLLLAIFLAILAILSVIFGGV